MESWYSVLHLLYGACMFIPQTRFCFGDMYRRGHHVLRPVFLATANVCIHWQLPSHGIFPGRTCLQTHMSEGRTFLQGAIIGAVPHFSIEELSELATLMESGCSKKISSFEVSSCLPVCVWLFHFRSFSLRFNSTVPPWVSAVTCALS